MIVIQDSQKVLYIRSTIYNEFTQMWTCMINCDDTAIIWFFFCVYSDYASFDYFMFINIYILMLRNNNYKKAIFIK